MLRKVMVENGLVEGLPAADPRITSFKGIPFAAPPVGKLRWRAPQPAENWGGVLKAYTYGARAMQIFGGNNPDNIYTKEWHVDSDAPMGEDCLQLNVWTPAKTGEEKLPVMVWIFGGALWEGYPSEMEFDGERIARRGVILVSINYRLNVFGFFAHPEITKEDPGKAANFGHWDQKAGIEWVKRNIESFGGDPGNITVFGQSAGGVSTIIQVTSPLNKGLFQKAIVHSGGGLILPTINSLSINDAEKTGEDFFEYLGVTSLDEARAMDAQVLLEKGADFGLNRSRWASVIDGSLIPDTPTNIIVQNKSNDIKVMMGNTVDELFDGPEVSSFPALEEYAREKYGDASGEYLDFCKNGADNISQMVENGTFNRAELGNLLWLEYNEKLSLPKMYYYVFNPEIPGPDNPGSFHSSDLWFAFETLAKCWRPFVGKHYDLARQMCNYWTNFAKTGNPNGLDADGSRMPEWTEYSLEEPYPMYFAENTGMDKSPRSAFKNFLVDFFTGKIENNDICDFFEI
jgi:para-nitrobenzyl esterase